MRLGRILLNVVLVAVALAVGLLLGEGVTRLVAPQQMSGAWFVVGPQGILMNRASGTARDALTPTRTATYEFNAWNQRGRVGFLAAAARVLVLGDSFTFGLGLALDDSYVGILQRRFDEQKTRPRLQLLNAAAGGWGTADQLAYLEAFGPRLAPSAVVVFVNAWDVARARAVNIYRVAGDGQGLTVHPVPAGQHAIKRLVESNPAYLFLLEHSHLLQLFRRAYVVALTKIKRAGEIEQRRESARPVDDPLQFDLIMRRMAAWCAENGAQLTVLTTGWPAIDYPWLDATMRADGIFFRALGDKVAGPVKADPPRYAIPGDGHPSEAGARLIADAAWPILEERLRGLEARPLR